MEPRLDYIRKLVQERNWSGSELARRMGVSRAEANRFLNGQRKGGKKLISGIIQAFSDEKLETLFILPQVEPKSNTADKHETYKENEVPYSITHQASQRNATRKLRPVRHPNAHQLACSINEEAGIIQILDGRNVTTLMVPVGPIEVRHSTKRSEDTS